MRLKGIIPIFIITRDRLTSLKLVMESYRKNINSRFVIVLHDNGSTYPPMLEFLEEYERETGMVYRAGDHKNKKHQLNSVSESIATYRHRYEFSHYIVTDPDIELCGEVPGDILEFYAFLLETHKVPVVGPSHRLDDIPEYYPLRNEVVRRMTERHFNKDIHSVTWEGTQQSFVYSKLDTVFGMYLGNFPFRRKQSGICTLSPYWARHLDWYINPGAFTEEQQYYLDHAHPKISHWGGAYLKRVMDGWGPNGPSA